MDERPCCSEHGSGVRTGRRERTTMNVPATIIEAADFYTAQLNWKVHPLVPLGKRPAVDGWTTEFANRPWEEKRGAFLAQHNIGVLTGKSSGNLLDVDLDRPEVRAIAARSSIFSTCWALGR